MNVHARVELVLKHIFEQVRMRLISQLIEDISRALQKLLGILMVSLNITASSG